jgi:hypothetical protein
MKRWEDDMKGGGVREDCWVDSNRMSSLGILNSEADVVKGCV